VRVIAGKSGPAKYQGYADSGADDAVAARVAAQNNLMVPQSPSQFNNAGGGAALGDGFGGGAGDAGAFGGGGGMDGGKGGKGRGADGRGGRGRGRGGQDDMVGKVVQLTKGAWKGYYGMIKAVAGATVRVELQGKEKIISAKKVRVHSIHRVYTDI